MTERERVPPEAPVRTSDARDRELVAHYLKGDQAAFEELVLLHRARLARMARRFLFDPADAEDVVQEAFVRAFTKLDRLRDGVPFRNWISRITINLCIDRIRSRRRRGEEAAPQSELDESEWIERQLGGQSMAEARHQQESREAKALLSRVLGMLGPKEQVILHLLYGEELTSAEVAEMIGWSEVNVRVRAFRARRALKKAIEKILNPK